MIYALSGMNPVVQLIDAPGDQPSPRVEPHPPEQRIRSDARGSGLYIYTGDIFTPLDVPGASNTVANGINDAGQVVIRSLDSHGFAVWRMMTMFCGPSPVLKRAEGGVGKSYTQTTAVVQGY